MRSASHHGSPESGDSDHDLCLEIQVNLSAMIDGEMDPAGVRRATEHSDDCRECRAFLDGVRQQTALHQQLAAAASAERKSDAGWVVSDQPAPQPGAGRVYLPGNRPARLRNARRWRG